MNKKREKRIFLLISILTLCAYAWIGSLVNKTILTDSGFDTSYDSGGSWGGDYGSSSDYHSDSSYQSSGSSEGGFIAFVIIIVFLSVFAYNVNRLDRERLISISKNKKMKAEEINKIIPTLNLKEFLNDRLEDYLKIQDDWSNMNYEGLREKLTDELYNQYSMQLKTLELKNQKNIMKKFKFKDIAITSLELVNGRYEAKVELAISFIDYIAQNGRVVRGSRWRRVYAHYEMVFVSSSDEVINKCPSCGAQLGDNNTEKCPYCHNVVSRLTTKWVLAKKEMIGQY